MRLGRGALLAALTVGLGFACQDGPRTSASEGLVFVRRHGTERTSPRDLAWVRLSDGHVEVLPSNTEEMWPYYSPVVERVVFLRGYAGRRRGRLWLWDPATGEQLPASGVNDRWESWADWSPSDPVLAYVALKRGHGGVEIQDFETGRRTVVAPTTGNGDRYVRPSFGPRRDLLVAQRVRAEDSDLYLLHADRPPEPLVVDPKGYAEKPVFRRDGGAVLYSSMPENGKAQLFEIELATRATRPLAPDPAKDRHTVAISPTRDEIAFVSEGDGRADLWLMALPDGPARPLTDTPAWDEYAPQWSPDGELIALTGGPSGEQGALIRVVDRSGAVRFETPGFSPDWMPPPAESPR